MSRAITLLCLILFTSLSVADSDSYVAGQITDRDSGQPYVDVVVEIFNVSDHSKFIDSDRTDARGQYNLNVPEGNYDIYVRLGKRNPTQQIYVRAGQTQVVDFLVSEKTIGEENIAENPGFAVVVTVAIIILIVILVDQLFFRGKRTIRELERERKALEEKLGGGIEGEPDVVKLQRERDRVDYMMNITKIKYHKREIGVENFGELMKDYQKKLIEIEARMTELKSG